MAQSKKSRADSTSSAPPAVRTGSIDGASLSTQASSGSSMLEPFPLISTERPIPETSKGKRAASNPVSLPFSPLLSNDDKLSSSPTAPALLRKATSQGSTGLPSPPGPSSPASPAAASSPSSPSPRSFHEWFSQHAHHGQHKGSPPTRPPMHRKSNSNTVMQVGRHGDQWLFKGWSDVTKRTSSG